MSKKLPFESTGFVSDGAKLWRRITGKGMVEKQGTLSQMSRVKPKGGIPSASFGGEVTLSAISGDVYELRFKESPEEVQGYVPVERTVNRIKKGERVGIQVDPETKWVRKIWPLDRKLKWYQV